MLQKLTDAFVMVSENMRAEEEAAFRGESLLMSSTLHVWQRREGVRLMKNILVSLRSHGVIPSCEMELAEA